MPRATVSTETERHELQSCPGGFVELRRMTHGQRLHRQDMAMSMSMQTDQRSKTAEMSVTPTQTKVSQFEFRTCIVDHNLEDEGGRKLNFTNPRDFELLDGRIGDEIGNLIDELHNWGDDLPNSEKPSASASSVPESPESN